MKKNNSALLVVDMIQTYIYGNEPLIPIESRPSLINNLKSALKIAHKTNAKVIYINSAFKESDPIYKKYINYRTQSLENKNEPVIISELKPKPKDIVIKKRGYDAFWKSNLEKLLKSLKISKLFLVGCQTDCCIRETAVTAAHLGYDVYVLEDCCQTNREFGQIAALRFMRNCTKGIITLKQFNSYL